MVRYRRKENEPVSGINITPFTDVILVLLIVFMISAPGIYMYSFKIQLPGSKSNTGESSFSLVIGIDEKGTIFLSDRSVSEEELRQKLTSLEVKKKEKVLLNADSRLNHGRVIEIVDLLRESGAQSVSVGTVPE